MGGPYLYLFGIEEESIITESPKYKNWFSGHKLLYHKHTHTHTATVHCGYLNLIQGACTHTHTHTQTHTYTM